MRTEEHLSAGGVVCRVVNGHIETVLCGRHKPLVWGLPKGTPDPGESPEETALREVREETGLEVALEADLGQTEYWFRKPSAQVHKRVRFFLMSPVGGSLENHDSEFDEASWFPTDVAVKTMTYPNEVEVLGRAVQQLEAGGSHAAPRR